MFGEQALQASIEALTKSLGERTYQESKTNADQFSLQKSGEQSGGLGSNLLGALIGGMAIKALQKAFQAPTVNAAVLLEQQEAMHEFSKRKKELGEEQRLLIRKRQKRLIRRGPYWLERDAIDAKKKQAEQVYLGKMRTAKNAAGKPGKVGGAVVAARFGAVALAAGAFAYALKSATDGLIAANRTYADVSASMALVMANRDIREMFRRMDKGNAVAGSAQELVDAEQRRKDATKPLEIAIENLSNKIAASFNNAMAEFVEKVNKAEEKARKAAEALNMDAGGPPGATKEAMENARKFEEERKKREELERKSQEPMTAGEILDAAHKDYEEAVKRGALWFTRRPLGN